MLDLVHSQLYANPEDVKLLKSEPEYVRNRYYTIIKSLVEAPFRWTRQKAADILHISKRHMQRLVKAFRGKGIPGLRLKSKIPRMSTALEKVIIVADEKVTTDANANPVGVGGCTTRRNGPSCGNRSVKASASGRWQRKAVGTGEWPLNICKDYHRHPDSTPPPHSKTINAGC